MTTAERVMAAVVEYFEEAMSKHPEITKDQLDAQGAIYYMNGNDGTDFDWGCNDRVCEFYVFHTNEMGYIKVFVDKNGVMDGYIYLDEGRAKGIHLEARKLDEDDVKEFAEILFQEADRKAIWDQTIDEIDFSAELTRWRLVG